MLLSDFETLSVFLQSCWTSKSMSSLLPSETSALLASWYNMEIGAVSPFVQSTELLNHLLHKLLFVLKTCFPKALWIFWMKFTHHKTIQISMCSHKLHVHKKKNNTDLGVNIRVSILADTQGWLLICPRGLLLWSNSSTKATGGRKGYFPYTSTSQSII